MIDVSEAAAAQLQRFLDAPGAPGRAVRVFVQGFG